MKTLRFYGRSAMSNRWQIEHAITDCVDFRAGSMTGENVDR